MNYSHGNVNLLTVGSVFEFTPTSVAWIVVFASTAIMSVAGNIVVILVFRARFPRKKCDTALKPYLINLAVSDLVMALFCMPFTFIDALSSWVFPATMCSMVLFFQVLAVSASVFTNVAIGLNRLRAIIFPLRSIYTLRTYSWVLILIWLASSGIASVQLFVGQTITGNDTIHCGEVWPTSKAARTYTVCIFAFVYAIPLMLLIGTYTTIGVALWKNPRRDELIKSKCMMKKAKADFSAEQMSLGRTGGGPAIPPMSQTSSEIVNFMKDLPSFSGIPGASELDTAPELETNQMDTVDSKDNNNNTSSLYDLWTVAESNQTRPTSPILHPTEATLSTSETRYPGKGSQVEKEGKRTAQSKTKTLKDLQTEYYIQAIENQKVQMECFKRISNLADLIAEKISDE